VAEAVVYDISSNLPPPSRGNERVRWAVRRREGRRIANREKRPADIGCISLCKSKTYIQSLRYT
jgi:hypothetical protein